jgi:hypothetical protein
VSTIAQRSDLDEAVDAFVYGLTGDELFQTKAKTIQEKVREAFVAGWVSCERNQQRLDGIAGYAVGKGQRPSWDHRR